MKICGQSNDLFETQTWSRQISADLSMLYTFWEGPFLRSLLVQVPALPPNPPATRKQGARLHTNALNITGSKLIKALKTQVTWFWLQATSIQAMADHYTARVCSCPKEGGWIKTAGYQHSTTKQLGKAKHSLGCAHLAKVSESKLERNGATLCFWIWSSVKKTFDSHSWKICEKFSQRKIRISWTVKKLKAAFCAKGGVFWYQSGRWHLHFYN